MERNGFRRNVRLNQENENWIESNQGARQKM